MGKAEWYGNLDCVARKDNYDEMLLKKEQLQKKFLEMCSKKSSTNGASLIKDKSMVEIKSNKKKEDKENKDLKVLRNQIKKQKKEIQNLRKENEKIKKTRFSYIEICKEKDFEINHYKKQLAMKIKEIESLRNENLNLQKEIKMLTNVDLNQELKSMRLENHKLKQRLNCVSENLKVANKQVQNYQQMRSGEVESSVLKKYRNRLNEKENEVENLKSKYISATATINILNVKMLKKREDYIHKKSETYKKNRITDGNCSNDMVEDDALFGFLSLNKNLELIFIDVNNKRYPIENQFNIGDKNRYIGMPARVIKNEENTVKLDYVYYNLVEGSKVRAVNKEKVFKIRKKKPLVSVLENEFIGKKILIMGSKHKDKYITAFKDSGAKVVWYDSFSDNESRIEDFTSSSDIVIVCTSHISHGAMYKIYSLEDYEEGNNKYQFIEIDNVNNIIARVRYAIENMK